jgi:hypothetical protein
VIEDANLSPRNRALYEKLYASIGVLNVAISCADVILKKKWHTYSFMRRGSVPIQQIAFTTALIVAYCRPFALGRSGKGNIEISKKLIRFNEKEAAFHARLLQLRNEEYAHTDASTIRVRPLKGDFIKSIDSIRDVRFSPGELNMFVAMTTGLVRRLQLRLEEVRLTEG